ncbi:MAG: Fis family transcriptional regulator [Proteobacteria bacterium]|nr:MAG: Fis family transcriptional regulator [Pseudomonadota bacterium]
MNRWILLSSVVVLAGCSSSTSSGDGDSDGDGDGETEGVSADASGEPDDATLNGIVKAHNEVRAEVGTEPLEWSSEVAGVAKAHAEKCNWGHSTERNGYGENLFMTTGSASASDVVGSWADEKKSYDPKTGECSGVCGHYTQIVWNSTRKLGCAMAKCDTGNPMGSGPWEYWVCNYDPPGNYSGQKAF